MTALTARRTRLTFETADCTRERGRLREVIIEAQPYLCVVRLKGTRRRLEISWAGIYNAAARLSAEKARAEKAEARKHKRVAR